MLYGSEACGFFIFYVVTKSNIEVCGVVFLGGRVHNAPILRYVSLSVVAIFWNRLISIEYTKLMRIVFLRDYQLNKNNWSSHVDTIFEQTNNLNIFYNLDKYFIDSIYERSVKKSLSISMIEYSMNKCYEHALHLKIIS